MRAGLGQCTEFELAVQALYPGRCIQGHCLAHKVTVGRKMTLHHFSQELINSVFSNKFPRNSLNEEQDEKLVIACSGLKKIYLIGTKGDNLTFASGDVSYCMYNVLYSSKAPKGRRKRMPSSIYKG